MNKVLKTKKEIIEYLSRTNYEFWFTDYGYCSVNNKGIVEYALKPCRIEINGGWDNVEANLNKLPKKYAVACLKSLNCEWDWTDWLSID